MLRLNEFKSASLSKENQRKVHGGAGKETDGGQSFFGYGVATCDWEENGQCTYYFDDPERWRLEGDC